MREEIVSEGAVMSTEARKVKIPTLSPISQPARANPPLPGWFGLLGFGN